MAAQERSADKAALIQQADVSRLRLSREKNGLKYEADVPARLRGNIGRNNRIWMGVAAFFGFIAAIFKRRARLPRKKDIGRRHSWLRMLVPVVQMLIPFAKTAVVAYSAKKVGGAIEDKKESPNNAPHQ